MCDFDENREPKPLTREMLEDFSNRCANLKLYKEGTSDYATLWSDIWSESEEYQSMEEFIHIVQENGKEGVKNDFFNHWIVPPVFDKVVCDTNVGYNYIVINNGKYGITSSDGKGTLTCPFIYDQIEQLGSFADLLKTTMNNKYGLIALYGSDFSKEMVKPIYDDIQETDDGYVILKKDGKYGLFKYGYVLPTEYERIFIPCVRGWIKVMKNGVWGYIDTKNEFTEDMNKAFLHL